MDRLALVQSLSEETGPRRQDMGDSRSQGVGLFRDGVGDWGVSRRQVILLGRGTKDKNFAFQLASPEACNYVR
jgi:hypothetical protein